MKIGTVRTAELHLRLLHLCAPAIHHHPYQRPSYLMASPQPLRAPIFPVVTVDQLKPGSLGHNLIVKVVSSQVVVDKARPDGSKVKVAEAVVGDHTGCITLTARNNQIEALSAGDTVVVRNAKIDMFKGFMRLAVDKWGSLKAAEQAASFQVKSDNNLSTVEYELVDLQK